MKQYVKLFTGFSISIDTQINEFLTINPNYVIDKITFDSHSSDRALVVFNVEEEQFRTHE
jgi:hypothetical protein